MSSDEEDFVDDVEEEEEEEVTDLSNRYENIFLSKGGSSRSSFDKKYGWRLELAMSLKLTVAPPSFFIQRCLYQVPTSF